MIIIERYDFFIALILQHIAISGTAVLIAGVIGLLLGILISEKAKLSPFVLGSTNFVYTIPSISMLGFLLPITGIGNVTAVIALSIYALLPMIRNTHAGINGVDKDILEVATGMGSTKLQILYKIKLPLAAPVIIAGLRNTVVMTIALAGVASFIGAGGLGIAIYRGITTNNYSMTVAGSLLIALLAMIADHLSGKVESITTWSKS
ncbi:MAG: ABC transporter permease [Deferribacteraceae bacterium]|jgi:osmoprotectant transport system permease protein|nr:ABC transporter permease [Deferribacteraceae bacterium]